MRFTRSSNRSARRATAATRAPSRASSSAVAAPIPEEAPVTRATRSFTSRSPLKSKASGSTDQSVRLLEDAAQCIQPFRPDDAIDHPVIAGQRDVDRGDRTQRLGLTIMLALAAPIDKIAACGGLMMEAKLVMPNIPRFETVKVPPTYSSGLQSLSAGAFPEVLHLRRYAGDPFLLGCEDDRGHETESVATATAISACRCRTKPSGV